MYVLYNFFFSGFKFIIIIIIIITYAINPLIMKGTKVQTLGANAVAAARCNHLKTFELRLEPTMVSCLYEKYLIGALK